MSIRLVVSDTVTVPVSGNLRDADGKLVPFAYTLKCKRLNTTALKLQIEAVSNGELTGDAFMSSVVVGWSGVADEDGKAVEFSEGALSQLWELPGMAGVAFAEFLVCNSAQGKAKN
ncbi:MAG: hypothetical protein ACOYMX_03490 [Burkholderiales bacterium]